MFFSNAILHDYVSNNTEQVLLAFKKNIIIVFFVREFLASLKERISFF